MPPFDEIVLWVIGSVIWSLTAMIAYFLLTKRIETQGLLLNKRTRELSPERLQLLVISLGFCFYYLVESANQGALWNPPNEVLAVLGGSHAGYLGLKALPIFQKGNGKKGVENG